MSDLIERLRGAYRLSAGLNLPLIKEACNDAIDEIERLQRENEELRKSVDMLYEANQSYEGIEKDLAALKAQSTEKPVAWMLCYQGQMPYFVQDESEIPDDEYVAVAPLYLHPPKQESTEPVAVAHVEYGLFMGTTRKTKTDLPDGDYWLFPANTTLPTATEMVADFKRRAVEVCMNKSKSVVQLNFAGGCEWCAEAIESLPLIGE